MEFQLERTKAIWEYIVNYAIENSGAAPSVRDFIHDNVDNITSTSIVESHLKKLEALGLIKRYHGEKSVARTIEIIGGLYMLPVNIRENKEPYEYDETIYPSSTQTLVERIIARKKLGEDITMIVVATDDNAVKMVAMGFGMPVISRNLKEWVVEEEDSRVSA